jgi:hypothetical protein
MQSVCQKADGMMKICEILAVFFSHMADYFDGTLPGVEIWCPSRYLSGPGLTEGRNNIIPRGKVTTETQKGTLVQDNV